MSLRDFALYVYGQLAKLWKRLCTDETRISSIERRMNVMADVLDDIDSKFDAFQKLAIDTIGKLRAEIAADVAGHLDPTKAQAIDDKITAAIAALTPPTA